VGGRRSPRRRHTGRGALGRGNTVRLLISLALLAVALLLFRAGTNYNWVTAVAS
jgi:hypothetical protein